MTYVSDIDGTLLRKGVQPILAAVAKLQQLHTQGQDIVLITSRPENVRNRTQVALRNAKIPYNTLLMNTYDSTTHGQLASKENNIRRLMLERGHIIEAVDNDPAVQTLYKSLGLNVKGKW